jgi:dihydrofolate reductase
MNKVIASITQSVDGYVTGPDDGAGLGLGRGGERLHYWVFGGPWTYDDDERDLGAMTGEDKAYFDALVAGLGAAICGRGMYDAAGAWGGTNPFDGPLFVVTHRTDDAPDPASGFTFVADFEEAVRRARVEAGDRDVAISGGADLIRQGLDAGVVDQLSISTAPVILGAGKRLFEGFEKDLDLDILDVHPSPYATHVTYAVRR